MCLLAIFGQSACPEVLYNVVCPFLAVWLACLNGVAVEVSATEELACTCIGKNVVSLMGREAAMPAKASARPFSVRLIFSIVHLVNRYKTRSLETDRARARANPDRMASYSASLLEAGNPSRWLAPDVLLLGIVAEARLRTLMIVRLHQLNVTEGWSVSTTTGGLGKRGGASGRRSEGPRLLAPFLNIWFLRPPMLC
ncbi:hypothetical protein CK203_096232 [Vitis vinifera]|uniref:Secreted protein n=1 Tax=Vitis vinifera TaxID=29760 RepID=A0A438EEZ8_VITVI|nr:hypothetical protein CK203_096232 [Vitis vinifera]